MSANFNDEIQLRQYVRDEQEKILSIQLTNSIMNDDYIQKTIKVDQAECLENLTRNLQQEMNRYSISEDLRKEMLSYAQTNVVNRFKSWETSSMIIAERNNMKFKISDIETQLKQYLRESNLDKSSAFENIWIDHLSRMKTVFNAEEQWRKIIRLIFELYQNFNCDRLLTFENVNYYLSFLISRTFVGSNLSFYDNLVLIRNECLSRVSNETPVEQHSNHFGYKTFDSNAFKHFQYIDVEKLNDTWSQLIQLSSSTETKYYEFCQRIFSDWSLFIDPFLYFEYLTRRINEISFEHALIQEVICVVNTLIKDINLELSVFQLKLSQTLQNNLHVCAVILISAFYYNEQKEYFNEMIQSIEQNQQLFNNYFIFINTPSEFDDTIMATNFRTDFCNKLLESFNKQCNEAIEMLIKQEQSKFSRDYFIKEINDTIKNTSDDWLMRYILRPMDIFKEKIDQQWCQLERDIDDIFRRFKAFHVRLLQEFFDNIISSDDIRSKMLKNKQGNMATIFYQYLLEKSPNLSNDLKEIFSSMKNQFEMYGINNFTTFLDAIQKAKQETDTLLTDLMMVSIKKTLLTVRNRLSYQARGCTVECPCCRRLCDFDHNSNKAFAIGQGDNKHCCRFGHQIQGLGDVHNALTGKAMTLCCEKLNDTDEISYRTFNIKQNWLDVKSTHLDWDFTDCYKLQSQSQEEISVYIWNRIGQQLCQHYQNEREHPSNKLVPNNFILLCGYAAHSSPKNESFLRSFRQLLKMHSTDENQSATKCANLWDHMSEISNSLLRIRNEKCTNDRVTIIANNSNATAINQNQIDQIFSDNNQCTDFSVLLKNARQQLQEIENDPKSNTLQHTFVFIISGDLDTFPAGELADLYETYQSLMKNVWIVTLRDEKFDYAQRLSNIVHGTLCPIDQWQDLYDVCSKISDTCDGQNLNPSTQISVVESTNSSNSTSFVPITTCEYNDYSSKIILPSVPEELIYDQICRVTFPFKQDDILLKIAEEMCSCEPNLANDDILIPLPCISKRSIDFLPKIHITLNLQRDQFNLKEFIRYLAQDLDVDENDLCVLEAEEGSIKLTITMMTRVLFNTAKMNNINEILIAKNLPTTKNFLTVNIQRPGPTQIDVALKNFERIGIDRHRLIPETIDHSLRLSDLMTVLDRRQSQFVRAKSQQISNCLMHAFRDCPFEFVLEHALLVYNEKLTNQYKSKYGRRDDNEKVLFHGTVKERLDGIFRNNFQYNINVKRIDIGWYGKGVYFSSSPRKALNYARSWKHDSIVYIICSIVAVGKSLTITNMDYRGREMHPAYDSHYVRTSWDNGEPIENAGQLYYEEFVIKNSERILPMYIIGIRYSEKCVIWRDLSISNEANDSILVDLRSRLDFNIYPLKTTEQAVNVLQSKISQENMLCAIITNGANEGQKFIMECRNLRQDIPIVIYCKSKAYHQQWAMALNGPQIRVTSNPGEVFEFINNVLNQHEH